MRRRPATHSLATIFGVLPCGLVVQSSTGGVVHANRAAMEMLGLTRTAAGWSPADAAFVVTREGGMELPADQMPAAVTLRTGRPARGEVIGVTSPGGERRWLLVESAPLPGRGGAPMEVVSTLVDITQHYEAERALENRAFYDRLTRLPNRALLLSDLEQALRDAQSGASAAALLVVRLHRVDELVNTLGQAVGDGLLEEAGKRLQSRFREAAMVSRLGDDEFAVLLLNVDREAAIGAAAAASAELDEPVEIQGLSLQLEANTGAVVSGPGDGPDTVIRRARVASQTAHRMGSAFALYQPGQDEYKPERLALMGEFRHAAERHQLLLHYQPAVEMRTGAVSYLEALVRWRHPRLRLMPPGEFVPIVEDTALINPFSLWVANAAVRRCREWQRAGFDVGIAINLSPRNLLMPRLAEEVGAVLARWDLSPRSLTIEITESAVMEDMALVARQLGQLKQLGVRIAIDDFGTGYASFLYLRHLGVDEVKIDRSFVAGLTSNVDDAAIVRSVIELGHSLGLRVVAEGVEDSRTLDLLAALGVDAAQGFLIRRPAPASAVTRWLRRTAASPASSGSGGTSLQPGPLTVDARGIRPDQAMSAG